MPRELRIDEALGRASISIEPEETPEELHERLRRERDAHRFELTKNYVLLFTLLIAVISVGAMSVFEAVFDNSVTPDTKRWAQTVLSSLFTGGLSFLAGLAVARKSK